MDEVRISREQAVQMARQVCEDWGWPWQESVVKYRSVWEDWVVKWTLSSFIVPIHKVEIVIDTWARTVVVAKHYNLLRGIPSSAKITREQAVSIARQVCVDRDWPLHEKGWWCKKRLGKWEAGIYLSASGTIPIHQIIVVIDAKTGGVIEAKYLCPPM